MQINIKPTLSTYTFEKEYQDTDEKIKMAKICLTIEDQNKTFSITPSIGQKEFSFIHSSHRYKLWVAITELIQEAIEFANDKLGICATKYTKLTPVIDNKPTKP